MPWLAMWKAKTLEQRGLEEEESAIDSEGKGRPQKKDMQGLYNSCRLARRREHERNRCETMSESDKEESLRRRRERERSGDGNI